MVSKIEQQSTAVSLTNVSSAPKDIKIAMEEGREAKSIFREVLCQVPTPPIAVANLLEPAPTLPASSLPSLQPPREEIDKTAMVTLEEEQARVVVREVLRKAILRTNQWLVFYEDGDECIEHEDDLNRE
jgi:hypothetical protein